MKLEKFDTLEEAIENAQIEPDVLVRSYRTLILALFDEGAFDRIPHIDMEKMRGYAVRSGDPHEQQDACAAARVGLWDMESECRDNPRLNNLVRVLICLQGKSKSWECAQDPVIFYLLYFLRSTLPDIEPRFVAHFARDLFGA